MAIRQVLFHISCLAIFQFLIVSVDGVAKCVYNQAYNENYESDSIEQIKAYARGCYVLLDPFLLLLPSQDIAEIAMHGNEVGCYMSSGTGESWRDDFHLLRPHLVEKVWERWQGEYFINSINPAVEAVMATRIDKMADWGCDWVEFDNMDWVFDSVYRVDYGFNVTLLEGVNYNNFLCQYTRSKGMKCMAKNTLAGAHHFDGVTYESYPFQYNWWDNFELQEHVDKEKLAVIVHYNETDCTQVLNDYNNRYGSADKISYVCESAELEKYLHFNTKNGTGGDYTPTASPTASPTAPPRTLFNKTSFCLSPYDFTVQKGRLGGAAEAMRTRDHRDDEENRSLFAECIPDNDGFSGEILFRLNQFAGVEMEKERITELFLVANIRSSSLEHMEWRFTLKDLVNENSVFLTNQQNVPDWTGYWQMIYSNLVGLPDGIDNYVNMEHEMRVVWECDTDFDTSEIDYLRLCVALSPET